MQNIQATILSFAPCADQTVEKLRCRINSLVCWTALLTARVAWL